MCLYLCLRVRVRMMEMPRVLHLSEWVMSLQWMSHVTCVNRSRHMYIARVDGWCEWYEWVMSLKCMSHVTCVNRPRHMYVARVDGWCDWYEWVMWHTSNRLFPDHCRIMPGMCDMTRSYVSHDYSCVWHDSPIRVPCLSFIRVIWLIRTRHMTKCLHVIILIHTCDVPHSYVWHVSSIPTIWLIPSWTWLVHTGDITHSYVWHASFILLTWLIYKCKMTHLSMDSSIHVVCLVDACNFVSISLSLKWASHSLMHASHSSEASLIFGDSRANMLDMYGDSRENLLGIVAVVVISIIRSPPSTATIPNKFSRESPYMSNMFARESPKTMLFQFRSPPSVDARESLERSMTHWCTRLGFQSSDVWLVDAMHITLSCDYTALECSRAEESWLHCIACIDEWRIARDSTHSS